MHLLITLAACVVTSFVFTHIVERFGLSRVVGWIPAGIVLGSPYLKDVLLEPNTHLVIKVGEAGFLALMFMAGMEISWSMLYKEKKDAFFVASFAAAAPLLLGFVIFYALGFPALTALTVGICMSITAEATKAKELMDMKKLETRVGSLMMSAGVLDDIVGMSLFVTIVYLSTGAFVAGEHLILLLGILAFLTGVFIHAFIGRHHPHISHLENVLLHMLIPFFFITIGINFSLNFVVLHPLILPAVVITGIAGKILGTLLTKPFITDLNYRQLYLIGWAMNSRGAVELAIAFVAFNLGLLNEELYSSLIIMALITTMIFPLVMRRMFKEDPSIMN